MDPNRRRGVIRRMVAGGLPTTLLATLLYTGAILPVASPRAPAVESRAHRLASGRVGAGFDRVVETGLPTQMVGFAWEGGADGAIEVRVEEGNGSRDWVRVEGDPTEGPDTDSKEYRGRTSAGPVWLGPSGPSERGAPGPSERGAPGPDARKVEVRVVQGELSGLTVHAIRTERPPSPGGIQPGGSIPTQPGIISRGAWGADESFRSFAPGCSGQPEYAPNVRFAAFHHTEGSNSYGPGDSAAILRGIYYFHTHTNQWCDVGYNFLVDRYGQVFEGRAGGVDRAVVGAHAAGFNSGSTGVAVMGSFTAEAVPEPAFQSVQALLAWKLSLHGVNPQGSVSAGGRTIPAISGHRDLGSTDCPGNVGYTQLPRLRSTVAASLDMQPLKITSVHSGKSLDVLGWSTTDGGLIGQYTPHPGANQQWGVQPVGNGYYRMVSFHSGKVLDIAGVSQADGALAIQYTWLGGINQLFRFEQLSPGIYRIVAAHTGKVLDVAGAQQSNGALVIQYTWLGAANQLWYLSPA